MKTGQIWQITGYLKEPPEQLEKRGTVFGFIGFGPDLEFSRMYVCDDTCAEQLFNWDINVPITLIGEHNISASKKYDRDSKMVVRRIINPMI